ncbi:hypothetical protein ACP4OV_003875 [Aristida adscensionis]
MTNTMVTFTVHRSDAELVSPASPTPHERKPLSDVDNQRPLRFYATVVEFFRRRRAANGGGEAAPEVDPAEAIKAALAKALVHYYPMAGRLRAAGDGRLAVSCTGEGVVFVAARADVRLDELGEPLAPPYPCVDELFSGAGDANDVIDKPLIFMQVTKFRCGGFAIGVKACHSMADAFGVIQFLKCVTDLARGDERPAVLPVWERERLMGRNPPSFASLPFVSDEPSPATQPPMQMVDMVGDYFFFGAREIAALQRRAEAPAATAFELITAAMWRCRAEALALGSGGGGGGRRASLLITMNVRGKRALTPPLPAGFYGNGFVFLVVEAAAGELMLRGGGGGATAAAAAAAVTPLRDTVELVRRAKREMATEGYVRSMVDLFAAGGAAPYAQGWTYVVSDITRIGEDALDPGWAERAGGGVPMVGDDDATKMATYQMRCKGAGGEDCVAASMYLPAPAMQTFREQIAMLTS